jgi:pyrroloquinoline quinone biosynthesis protein D
MMQITPIRSLLSMQSKPVLKRHVRLQYDKVRGAWALLERVFWPNEVSLDILRLCDGQHSVAQMIALLGDLYGADEAEITPDVTGFLQEWSDKFLVTL